MQTLRNCQIPASRLIDSCAAKRFSGRRGNSKSRARPGDPPEPARLEISHSGRKTSVRPDSLRRSETRIRSRRGSSRRLWFGNGLLFRHRRGRLGGSWRGLGRRFLSGRRGSSRCAGRLGFRRCALGLGLANRGHQLIARVVFGCHSCFTISSTSCLISSAAAAPWLPTSRTLRP